MLRVVVQSLAMLLLIFLLVANFVVVKTSPVAKRQQQQQPPQQQQQSPLTHTPAHQCGLNPINLQEGGVLKDRLWAPAMLHYCLAHTAYHWSRRLPKHSRLRFQILVLLVVTFLLTPQLFVLFRPNSSRYCEQPLLSNLTGFIAFTFLMTGFTILLTLMDPVPREVKVAFHVFGVGSFAQGLLTIAFTVTAPECAKTTPELYRLSLVLSVLSALTTVFMLFTLPFWLANVLYPGMLLNQRSRAGLCHQPVSHCSCLWHV